MISYSSLFFAALLIIWIWVSVVLFRLYCEGVEVVFNLKYRASQYKKTSELRRQFTLYLTFLWFIEVVTGVGTIILLALMIKGGS